MTDGNGDTHRGTCFCGGVEIEVSGAPAEMGFCHCRSCRSWSGGPVAAFLLYPKENVRVTRGEDKLAGFNKRGFSDRRWCADCGGHVLVYHPTLPITDVHAATVPSVDFRPAVHLNYAETVLPMQDGLPKLRDLPAEIGGSGETVPE
jgi:hypothetical protein